MSRPLIPVLLGATLSTHAAFAGNAITQATDDGYVEAGDYIQLLVPATGFLAAWLHDDYEGAKQLTFSIATTAAVVQTGKFAVGRLRPNASNTASFPSGHTSAAFSGAAFLQSRYGAEWGIPGYIAATYVGGSRIYGNRHYADDVLAGAGIAFLVNQYFVSGYTPEGVMINAQPTDDGVMVNVSVTNDVFSYDNNKTQRTPTFSGELHHAFTLNVGFNNYDSLADLGASDALSNTTPLDPHQPFAFAKYTYRNDDNRSIEVNLSPNETRRSGIVTQDFDVNGTNYATGEAVFMALRQWQLGVNYIQHFPLSDQFTVSAGVGASWYLVEFESDLENGGRHSALKDTPLLPAAVLQTDYALTDHWGLKARAELQAMSGNQVSFFEGGINYQINRDWEVEMKYSVSKSEWDKLNTKYHTEAAILALTNRF